MSVSQDIDVDNPITFFIRNSSGKDDEKSSLICFDMKEFEKVQYDESVTIIPRSFWWFYKRYINNKCEDFTKKKPDGKPYGYGGFEDILHQLLQRKDFTLPVSPFLLPKILLCMCNPFSSLPYQQDFTKFIDLYIDLMGFLSQNLRIPYKSDIIQGIMKNLVGSLRVRIVSIDDVSDKTGKNISEYLGIIEACCKWFNKFGGVAELIEPFFEGEILNIPIPSKEMKPQEKSDEYMRNFIVKIVKHIYNSYNGRILDRYWISTVNLIQMTMSLLLINKTGDRFINKELLLDVSHALDPEKDKIR